MNVIQVTRLVLEFEEGRRNQPYYCSEGYPTVGIGFKIGDKGAPLPKFTLPDAAMDAWMDALLAEQPGFEFVSEPRQVILRSMHYQMGGTKLAGFKNMMAAIRNDDYAMASLHMLDSLWAKQTPNRAHRHASVMKTNDIKTSYPFLEL